MKIRRGPCEKQGYRLASLVTVATQFHNLGTTSEKSTSTPTISNGTHQRIGASLSVHLSPPPTLLLGLSLVLLVVFGDLSSRSSIPPYTQRRWTHICIQWVVWIWARQERLDGQQHSPNLESRRPFVYVQTRSSDMCLASCK